MNKNKKIKYIIFSLIMMFAVMCPNFSSAWDLSLGSSLSVGYDSTLLNSYSLLHSTNLYCINHNQSLSSYTKNSYTVSKVITIDGQKATSGGMTTTSPSNAKMAYILTQGNLPKNYGSQGNYSSRQKAVYRMWNEWIGSSGMGMGGSGTATAGWDPGAESLYNAATEYAKNAPTGEAAIESSSDEVSYKANGTTIGPLKMKYNANEIDKITIYYTDKSEKDISAVYSDIDCKNQIKLADLKSGTKFYIREAYNSKEATKIKVHVKSKPGIGAKLHVLDGRCITRYYAKTISCRRI